jgi:3'-phosphoadenosine 5'-phosphosulfate sulfotransferase
MPYFVYRVNSPQNLEYLDTKDAYRAARELVRTLRSEQQEAAPGTVRLIFAKTRGEAEKLLSAPRDDRVIGED